MNTLWLKIMLLATLSLGAASAYAIEHDLRKLDEKNQIKKKFWPSRLDDSEDRKCAACEEKEAQKRTDYLSRVLASNEGKEFRQEVQSQIMADPKFVKRCWSQMAKKEVDLFFTVNVEGMAEDIAAFPRRVSTSCLKRHIKKIKFAKPESAQHLWVVVSNS